MFHSPSSCASTLKTCGRWRNCRSLKRECRLWPPQGRQCVRRNQTSTKWFLRFILAHQNIQRQKPKYYQGFSSFIFAGFVPTPIWLRPQHWHATCVIHSEHTFCFLQMSFEKNTVWKQENAASIYIYILLYYLYLKFGLVIQSESRMVSGFGRACWWRQWHSCKIKRLEQSGQGALQGAYHLLQIPFLWDPVWTHLLVFYAHEETNCVSKIWVVGGLVFVSGPFTFHVGPRCPFGIHLFDFHVLVSKDTIDNFRYSSNDVYIHTDPWMLFGFAGMLPHRKLTEVLISSITVVLEREQGCSHIAGWPDMILIHSDMMVHHGSSFLYQRVWLGDQWDPPDSPDVLCKSVVCGKRKFPVWGDFNGFQRI